MKQKNLIIEVLEGAEEKRTYIIREIPTQPNQPAAPLAVCESGDEIAAFFDSFKF